MELTICLITKGRIQYLEPLLESLEGVFQFDWVKILIILNGADQGVISRISEWSDGKQNLIVEQKDKNDARPSVLWPLVRKHTDGWCIFISDDDLFHFEVLPFWQTTVSENKDLIAISTLSQIIDSDGHRTGEIRKSVISNEFDQMTSIALALHQPPFSWPTLFFDVSKLPPEIPNSRYVFDWWVGIQLLLAGDIGYLDDISISYRNHPLQESHLATHKRKFFEAFVWFENLLDSERFKEWLINLSDQEIKQFWKACLESPPIYCDPIYSNIILNKLRLLLVSLKNSIHESQLLADFALVNGVLLKDQEIGTMLPKVYNDYATASNVKLSFLPGSCGNAEELTSLFSSSSSSPYLIGCRHSLDKPSDVTIIDCEILSSKSPVIAADFILIAITDRLEKSGSMNLTITPREKKLLMLVRKLRTNLPNPILNFWRRLLS